MSIKAGITGQAGFMGYHLFNYLKLQDDIIPIPFEDNYFDNPAKLNEFVSSCDVIVHLAGVNRHESDNYIYERNVELAELLIKACNDTKSKPFILFSSSTQEARDNSYGKGKKQARELFVNWSEQHQIPFTGMIIPNVFGPFGKPFYNSVVVTFCHQVMNDEEPQIKEDASMDLIYVTDLVESIYSIIKNKHISRKHEFIPSGKLSVSGLLMQLQEFKSAYIDHLLIPVLKSPFDLALFNTFRSFYNIENYPLYLEKHTDDRGSLSEVVKEKTGGQIFFSSTKPGITRGDHFHLRKIERFCVIQGEATIRLRKIGENKVYSFNVSGNTPSIIDMPVLFTHNITNIGQSELLTLFWSNEIFDKRNPDTYYEKV